MSPRGGLSPRGGPLSLHQMEGGLLIDESTPTVRRLAILLQQAGPTAMAHVVHQIAGVIALMFAARYPADVNGENTVLAGMILAFMYDGLTCESLMWGMSSAIDTLASQHNGAHEYKRVGLTLWRSWLILAVIVLPLAYTMWLFADSVFLALGVSAPVRTVINNYFAIRVLSTPASLFEISFMRYSAAIGVVQPQWWSSITFNIAMFILCYTFVYVFEMNYLCLAWAMTVSHYIELVVLVFLSLQYAEVQRTLQPWSKAAWQEWGPFIRLSVPGAILICAEWWVYELLTALTAPLGTNAVAAVAIVVQLQSLLYTIPYGVAQVTSCLVGNSLGAGKKQLAVQLGRLAFGVTLVLGVVVGACVFALGPAYIRFYTPDQIEVQRIAASLLLVTCFIPLFDGLQQVATGIMHATGNQTLGDPRTRRTNQRLGRSKSPLRSSCENSHSYTSSSHIYHSS
eukprot:gnl/Spiro4/4363_TR2167_c0_g1_i1.p1 gnl/Spiro4/4363_TR2167_c0_g1~~gnl/Spiro4/4363_TR2167_c0_g1_i1.p1  ORF type:complete len:489 (-),score=123.50 gnl/Spiro4/4363_TR2167_c0_g1_i1:1853-3217(-)